MICEAVAQTEDFTTAPPPTRPPNIPCHEGDETWIKRTHEDDVCYAFIAPDYVNYGLSWRQAHGISHNLKSDVST